MASIRSNSDQNIHALGLGYIYSYLSREGYAIYEVDTDPNHPFQILAKRENEFIIVAVRSAYHPDIGSIDKTTQQQLIEESDRLNAIPHFAGLTVTPVDTHHLEIDGFAPGKEYEIIFNGITIV
jgi:hypothetical protein